MKRVGSMQPGLLAVVAVLAACGPKGPFKLSADENNAFALGETLAKRQLPAQPSPVNSFGTPRVFVVSSGKPRTITAYDVTAQKTLWSVDADIQSRVAVGGDFVAEQEGKDLVARDGARGAVRWKAGLDGTLVGVAADRERAYVVVKAGSAWSLTAYDGSSGKELWHDEASGALGAPGAHGGVVYVPFLDQWLAILDGKTGGQLTRLRGIDEQIAMLRVTSTTAYYGSKQGVFKLDNRSSSGRRAEASYGRVKIPPQLDRTTYGRDMYDAVQAGYTANDRARVLWATIPGDRYAIHYFRFVFGFDAKGEISWAYSNPRVELVASDHTGSAIVAVSTAGELVALDPATGALGLRKPLGITGQVIGATFDTDGWAPPGPGEPNDTPAALESIARDHDARFDRVKELAVRTLARREGGAVTSALLAVLADNRAPQALKDTVVELLIARRDPASLPVLTRQLAVKTDFIARTEPEALGPCAKAIAGLGTLPLDQAAVTAALAVLTSHLDAPTTTTPELVQIIEAMAAIGHGAERPALWSHLLLYHAEDQVGGDPAWQSAIVHALDDRGPGERQLFRHVAADPRTRPGLAAMLKTALGTN